MFAASHSAAFPSQFDMPAGSNSSGLDFGKLGKKAEKIAVSGRGGKAEDILALMGQGGGGGIEEQIMAQI